MRHKSKVRGTYVYVATGPAQPTRSGDAGTPPSVRAEVLDYSARFRVRMPDGTEREVTDDDLVYSRRDYDDLDVEVVKDVTGDDERIERHPSFGMIGVYHAQGASQIFGSRVDQHHHHTTIRIWKNADRRHRHGEDRYFATDEIIEVQLTSARFTELVGAPNHGHGVPCSIRYHSPIPGPGMIPTFPVHKSETQLVVERVRAIGQELVATQATARADLQRAISKLPKSKQAEILEHFDEGARLMSGTAPFLVKQATEALEAREAETKLSVEAFVSSSLKSIGVEEVTKDPNRLRPYLSTPGDATTPTLTRTLTEIEWISAVGPWRLVRAGHDMLELRHVASYAVTMVTGEVVDAALLITRDGMVTLVRLDGGPELAAAERCTMIGANLDQDVAVSRAIEWANDRMALWAPK